MTVAEIAPIIPLARPIQTVVAYWNSYQLIQKAGFGEYYRHTLGHGISLDIHEQPRLSFRQDGQLLPNQVVTVEPGIYLKSIGDVRLENDVVVTEDGREVLCNLPLDAEWAVIETKERPVRAPHYDAPLAVRR